MPEPPRMAFEGARRLRYGVAMQKSGPKVPAVSVVGPSGEVDAQNDAAFALFRGSRGGPCWRRMQAHGRGDLPCDAGCVARLLTPGGPGALCEVVEVGGWRQQLCCVRVGDQVVSTLAPITPVDRDHPTLTSRELEVLRLLAAGQTDAEVAAALGIAPRTARAHAENIRMRLEVPSRAAAVSLAWRVGLLP